MEKLKYPRIIKIERLQIPVFREKDKAWVAAYLNEDGTTEMNGFAGHHTEESCWRVCLAYNGRIGYSEERTKEILKEMGYGKKDKKDKKQKKDKKLKKSKKSKKDKT